MKIKWNPSPERFGQLAVCAISAWCIAAWLITFAVGESTVSIAYAEAAPIWIAGLSFGLVFLLSAVISKWINVTPFLLLGAMLLYGTRILFLRNNLYLYLTVCALFAIAVSYFISHLPQKAEVLSLTMSRRTAICLILAAGIVVLAYLLVLTLCRFFSYSSPCFDFGIFAQMFHNMRESLLPLTTCERDGLLSHFAVHVSPIFYIYLPFYALIPHPVTLIVMQALVLFSGVIPLILLTKKMKLSSAVTVMISVLYFIYPAMLGGCFYDVHENKLLLPLLLWFFFFLEHKHYPFVYLFAVLVLMVKEDAPIYIAFAAIYWLCTKPRKRHGVILLVLSVAYFIAAVWYLETHGDGAMFGRYKNLIGYEGTPVDLVRTAFVNPGFILYELLDPEKLGFVAYILLPIGVLPFMTRRYGRLILILPMLLINLMPDYFYQHDIGYQYTYGVTAMLFYLLVINLPDLSGRMRRGCLIFGLCAAVLLGAMRMPSQTFYLGRAVTYADDNARITECLEIIPDDASVRASTMFIPHLSQRDELYVIESRHDAEYVALDLRAYVAAHVEGYDVFYFETRGYELLVYEEGLIAIFRAEE